MRPTNCGLCPVPFRTDTVCVPNPCRACCAFMLSTVLPVSRDRTGESDGHICIDVSTSCMAITNCLSCPIFAGKYSCFTELLIQRCCSFRRVARAKTMLAYHQSATDKNISSTFTATASDPNNCTGLGAIKQRCTTQQGWVL